MDIAPPKRNPLFPILVGFLLAGFFDFRFYFLEHQFIGLGFPVVGSIAVFTVLFFLRSRFAWMAAVVVMLILVAAALLTFRFGYMDFSLTWPLAVIDLVLLALFLLFLWKTREPYLRFVERKK